MHGHRVEQVVLNLSLGVVARRLVFVGDRLEFGAP